MAPAVLWEEVGGQDGSDQLPNNESQTLRAKQYHRTKLVISLSQTLALFLLVVVMLALGWTETIAFRANGIASDDPLVAFFVFVGVFFLLESVLTLPGSWYSGFYLEHKYNLSNQSLPRWLGEKVKAAAVSVLIILPLLWLLYESLHRFGNSWWIPIGVAAFLFSVVLARLAPIVILPLFYKFTPLTNADLRNRLIEMCHTENLHVNGVFAFNMSKNTKKANAGFAGIGKAKRIILSDTLLENFSEDEITTVFAHELGHYRHGHIGLGIAAGAVMRFVGLYLTAQLYALSLAWFGFEAITDLAALPLLGVWLGIYSFVTTPLNNMLSRLLERQADRFALERTPDQSIFVSAMKKLASMNLEDPSPHPMIEFMFYSHPSVEKRIRAAEKT